MAKLYFKYGAMGSSKTAQALITKFNYEERGMKVWLIKPAVDVRDGKDVIRSRVGLSEECTAIDKGNRVFETFTNERIEADVIIADATFCFSHRRFLLSFLNQNRLNTAQGFAQEQTHLKQFS